MYSIKRVAGLTGVSEAALRAWEARYSVVSPERSPGGYRLYSDEQVEVLREMAALIASGVPASRAAAVLLTEPPQGPSPHADRGPDLLEAAERLDPSALADVIADGGPRQDFEGLADAWLPARLDEMGQAWTSGRLGIAEEHFASAALMRAIGAVFDGVAEPEFSGRILVGLPAGNRHELMLFAFATCLGRLGADVVYLGADVPIEDWERAAREHRARAAVVGVTAGSDPGDAQRVLDGLRSVVPPVSLWVGGSRRSETEGASELPDAPSEAARMLHRSLLAGV